MGNILNKIFFRNTSGSLPALPEAESRLPTELIKNFNDASFNTSCRTQAFRKISTDSQSDIVWRKAVRIPSNSEGHKWNVYEVKEKNIQNDSMSQSTATPNHNVKLISKELSFFEAIENLSLFEECPFANPDQPHEHIGITVEELDTHYFKNLAHIEGIIFDLQGFPYPTVDGEVICEANYSAVEIKKLQKVMQQRNDRKINIDETFIETLMSKDLPKISLKDIDTLAHNKNTIAELIPALKTYISFLRFNIFNDYNPKLIFNQMPKVEFQGLSIELQKNKHYDIFGESYHYRHYLTLKALGPPSQKTDRKLYPYTFAKESYSKKLPEENFLKNYYKCVSSLYESIHKNCETLINELTDKQPDLKVKLSHILDELGFLSVLSRSKHLSSDMKSLNEYNQPIPQEHLQTIKLLKRAALKHFRNLKGKREILKELETSMLTAQYPEEKIDWARFEGAVNDLEIINRQHKRLISNELNSQNHNIDKQTPSPL
jgi:hypothetical protein